MIVLNQSGTRSGPEIALGIGTLPVMVGLNVWSKGSLGMYCAINGILVGVAVGTGMGDVNGAAFPGALSRSIVALPKWSARLPKFRLDLAIPFTITALACCLRAVGDITNAQRINDRDWVLPEMTSIRNGLFADGLSTMASSFLGSVGGNTYSASIGLSSATGVTSRWISLRTGSIFIGLSLFPIAAAAVVSIPHPVVGAALLFNSSFILISGIQIITSRFLDSRKTFTVGLALVLSIGRDMFPGFYRTVSHMLLCRVGLCHGFTDENRAAQAAVRKLIWRSTLVSRRICCAPTARRKAALRKRFERIFTLKTGLVTLDRLLARLYANKSELLMVLDRPEIPLHTNGSENDIRCQVTRRKLSGGTRSDLGRDCRDAFHGLAKTYAMLKISFWDNLGDRLVVPGVQAIPHLPETILARAQSP